MLALRQILALRLTSAILRSSIFPKRLGLERSDPETHDGKIEFGEKGSGVVRLFPAKSLLGEFWVLSCVDTTLVIRKDYARLKTKNLTQLVEIKFLSKPQEFFYLAQEESPVWTIS